MRALYSPTVIWKLLFQEWLELVSETKDKYAFGSRVLVEDSIYEQFRDRFVDAVESMVVGDPSDEATELGALISSEHLGKVSEYVEVAKRKEEICR